MARSPLPEAWLELWERSPRAPVFLHPGWQQAWRECFGHAPDRTIAVWNCDRLQALAPLFEYEGRLVFNGNGISDRLDVLGDAESLLAELAARSLDLQEIPEGSVLLKLPHEPASVSPALELSQPLSAKLRKNLRLQSKYLDGDIVRAGAEALEDLFRLHGLRWPGGGALAEPGIREFHRRAAASLESRGHLRLYVLRKNRDAIGVFYGFAAHGTTSYYLGGFDPEWERFGPGSLLIGHAIEQARVEGHHTFDFLRGSEPYKYRWGATDRQQYAVHSYNPRCTNYIRDFGRSNCNPSCIQPNAAGNVVEVACGDRTDDLGEPDSR